MELDYTIEDIYSIIYELKELSENEKDIIVDMIKEYLYENRQS
jgi:hypothetical protein